MLDWLYVTMVLRMFLTISNDGQNRQIHLSFPVGAFLESNAVSGGGKDVPERIEVQTHAHKHRHVALIVTFDSIGPDALCI